MMVVGSAGLIASLIAEGWYFSNSQAYVHSHGMAGLAATLAFLAFFEISLGPVFWLLISELFPLRVRSRAMALCTMVNWTFNFLVSYFYLTMTQDLGKDGTFYFFAFFAAVPWSSPSSGCRRPRIVRWSRSPNRSAPKNTGRRPALSMRDHPAPDMRTAGAQTSTSSGRWSESGSSGARAARTSGRLPRSSRWSSCRLGACAGKVGSAASER